MALPATILDTLVEQSLDDAFHLAQIGKCVDGAAHDLNNFLGAVLAYNELILMEEGIDPNTRRMLEECSVATRKASHLVATLTILARPLSDTVVHGEVAPLA